MDSIGILFYCHYFRVIYSNMIPGIVADLSFQTAARILAAPVELALVVMKDISQNFPTKAR